MQAAKDTHSAFAVPGERTIEGRIEKASLSAVPFGRRGTLRLPMSMLFLLQTRQTMSPAQLAGGWWDNPRERGGRGVGWAGNLQAAG